MNKFLKIGLLILAVFIIAFIASQVTLFEDGSFAFGSFPYPVSGCLPWGICK